MDAADLVTRVADVKGVRTQPAIDEYSYSRRDVANSEDIREGTQADMYIRASSKLDVARITETTDGVRAQRALGKSRLAIERT